jgi:hypothetical protein
VFSIFQNEQTPERLKDFAEHGRQRMERLATTPMSGSFAWLEELGGTAEAGPDTNPDGLVYSRLVDPRGNRFALFRPPATTQNA